MKETAVDSETGKKSVRFVPDFHEAESRITNNAYKSTFKITYDDEKTFTSFRDYLDNWVQIDDSGTISGMSAILKKLSIATEWYTEKWGLYLFKIRKEVKRRQNEINDYVRDNVTIFEYE